MGLRIRSIKPEFWRDENLWASRRAVRLVYILLWQSADDAGFFRWHPGQLAMDLHGTPDKAPMVAEAVELLRERGRVELWACGHGAIPTLPRHQRVSATKAVLTVSREHVDCPAGPRGTPRDPVAPRGIPWLPTGPLLGRLGGGIGKVRGMGGEGPGGEGMAAGPEAGDEHTPGPGHPREYHPLRRRGGQQSIWDEPHAYARRGDPATSWEAAESVDHIRESQSIVLAVIRTYGPMTDTDIMRVLSEGDYGRTFTPSGARTRRSELVDMGLVIDSGQRKRLVTGRRSILWVKAP